MQENEGIADDVASRIRYGSMRWKEATGVLCDKKFSLKNKKEIL